MVKKHSVSAKTVETLSWLWKYLAVRWQQKHLPVYEHIQLYENSQDIQQVVNKLRQ